MCLLIDAIIDQLRRWFQCYRLGWTYERGVVESRDRDFDYVQDLYEPSIADSDESEHGPKRLAFPRCYHPCVGCGRCRHINSAKCPHCGFIIHRKALDWIQIAKKAPKSPSYTSKRLFQRIYQLHAAHHRDVIILVFNQGAVRKKGRCYGTPGAAQTFLKTRSGKLLNKAWRKYMLEGKHPKANSSELFKSKKPQKKDVRILVKKLNYESQSSLMLN